MILSHGVTKYTDHKKEVFHYKFFDDPIDQGKEAIFGLDIQLMKLVNVLKAAARRYGPERRVLLLHGPVGSSKSTIVRLLKKGIEYYSRTSRAALHVPMAGRICVWRQRQGDDSFDCPMHEIRCSSSNEFPERSWRCSTKAAGGGVPRAQVRGDLCPRLRATSFKDLLRKYAGDWTTKVIGHVKVHRLQLSERGFAWHRNVPAQRTRRTRTPLRTHR